jgi:hypothetical protein
MDIRWGFRRFSGQLVVPRGCARASTHDPECDEQTDKLAIPQDDDPSIRTASPMTRTTTFAQKYSHVFLTAVYNPIYRGNPRAGGDSKGLV